MTTSEFLASIEQRQAEIASQPDPQEEFAKAQFQAVIDAMNKANKAMLSFLKAYKPVTTVDNFPDSVRTPDIAEVTKAIKALEKSLKPASYDNSDVVKAIKGLQLNPTYKPEIKVAPTPVTVKAPVVKVDKPDLTPITKAIEANKPEKVDLSKVVTALKDVSQQIIKKPTPVANTPTDPLIYYLPADIDDAGTVQYYGYTDNRGAWYVRQFDTSVSPKTIRFAFGQSGYTTNWANRASLTYKVWGS